MSKKIATIAMAAVMSLATVIPAAQADPGRNHNGNRHGSPNYAHNDGGNRHRGGGHWHNGQWIALGILGAVAAAAVADAEYGDCYTRHGRRYCE
jgi:hypothetical protein